MRSLFKTTFMVAALAFMFAPLAEAKTFVSVNVGSGPGWYHHGYYGPYYGPRYWPHQYVYYAPAPVVYAQPVIVQQPPIVLGPQVASYNGEFCREYNGTANIGGVFQHTYGTACLQPDGSWRIAN
jgi:hypothetical protein